MRKILARYGYHVALVGMIVGLVLGLSACDDGKSPSAPAPAHHDTTGTVRPYMGYDGKVGVGIDLGGGLVMGTNGKLGYGF